MGIFDTMKTEQLDISELIPQRPPMVMIDSLLHCDDTKTITSFFILKENIFCKNGYFTEPGIIENIAQTAAARIGYLNKIHKQDILIGYIGAIKNLEIYFLPDELTKISTEITINTEIMGFTLIHGQNMSDGKICAECEMRLFSKQES